MRFVASERSPGALLIASAGAGDGKSTVASHLAEAAASAGSRVLLLEVDMRQPSLARRLGIEDGPGLADVLLGTVPIDEATQSVEFAAGAAVGLGARSFDFLGAGAILPANPVELLESEAMDAVLERAKAAYDLVVLDAPPIASVSDTLALLTKVDGVVMVGWMGRSRRDVAERLHQVLASSGAPLIGVIANGAKSVGSDPYLRAERRDRQAAGEQILDGTLGYDRVPSSSKA
jgi:capsular exopolysaccharide synthesis family protein